MRISLIPLVLFFLLSAGPLLSQNHTIDSLTSLLEQHPEADTTRAKLLNKLAYELTESDPEKSRILAEEALELARQLKFFKGEALSLNTLAIYYFIQGNYTSSIASLDQAQQIASRIGDSTTLAESLHGKAAIFHTQSDYPQAMQYYLHAMELFEKIGKQNIIAPIMRNIGVLYKEMGDHNSALTYFLEGLEIQEQQGDKNEIARFLNSIAGIYYLQKKYVQAEETYLRSLSLFEEMGNKYMIAHVLRNMFAIKGEQGDNSEGLAHGFRALVLFDSLGAPEGIVDVSYALADAYLQRGKADSAIYYANQALALADSIGLTRNIYNTYDVLAKAHAAQKNFPQAYQAQQLYLSYKDSLTGEEQQNLVAGLKFKYELDKKQAEIALLTKDKQLQEVAARHQRQQLWGLQIVLLLVGLLAVVLVGKNRQKQRANKLLQQQKEEIDQQAQTLQQQNEEIQAQRDYLEQTLSELQATQSQLIQKEKMASLGELTAGIAHEIQNPLNFVNNFARMSEELCEELQQELDKASKEEVPAIIDDLKQNLERICHHGQRADSIVKNMLQHSRANSGERQPTDINALADEYLRLAYHGLIAKDKDFNAKLSTDFDAALGKAEVVPQELGRVLLNLYNNAFYATAQKQKITQNGYLPEVKVSTKRKDNSIEISVRDNGTGMSEVVKQKVFQPFFTTKPTGEGTGLGLSLSYDIITKGHGGEIKVDSREGECSEFTILLPVKKI